MTIKCPKCGSFVKQTSEETDKYNHDHHRGHCNRCHLDVDCVVGVGFDEFESLHVYMRSKSLDGKFNKSWHWIDNSV
jgi:hypothetical protein